MFKKQIPFPIKNVLTAAVTLSLLLELFLYFAPFSSRKAHFHPLISKKRSSVIAYNRMFDLLAATPTPTVFIPTVTPTPTPTPIPRGFCIVAPVLMFHHIEPLNQAKSENHSSLTVDNGRFDQDMGYLISQGYKVITAEDLANALISKQSPGKVAVVTLDDGYSDAYVYAFPIAQKYNITLSLFIPTGLIENPGYLSWGHLSEMVNSGHAKAYDHTWSHFSLPSGSLAKVDSEISLAKTQLEQHFGGTQKIFAYPYGTSDTKSISVLQKYGFIAAYSTIYSTLECDSYLLELRRIRIGNAPLSAYGV